MDGDQAEARYEDVRRELRVALLVPEELDSNPAGAPAGAERAELLARLAELELRFGEADAARVGAEEALRLDEANARAKAVLEALP